MKLTGKKILMVLPDFPYPPNSGARVEFWGRIKVLYHLGFVIDLTVTAKDDQKPEDILEVNKYVREIFWCPRRRSVLDMFSIIPWQAKSRQGLKDVALTDDYDFVLLESEFTILILDNPTLRAQASILRIHNNEPVFFKELSQSIKFGLKKLYYLSESFKLARLQSLVSKRIKNMMFISEYEFLNFNLLYPEINAIWLPPAISIHDLKTVPVDSRQVLFIGTLSFENNQEAIKWYVQKVHPLLNGIPGYQLIIAGNRRNSNLEWLSQLIGTQSNIIFVDSPEDLEPLYRQSTVFINPVLHGAGVKIKTLHALIHGLPVVSTPVGNQGTGLRDGMDILIAEDSVLFASHVRSLMLNPTMGRTLVTTAQKFLAEHYNQEFILEKYLSSLVCIPYPVSEKGGGRPFSDWGD